MGDIATVSGSQVGSNQRNQQQQGKSADVEDVSPVGSDLVQEIGKDVLVSKGAATRLSPFPADVRPKTMAIAVMMVMTTIFVSFFVSTLTKNCPYHDEATWDATCYYVMTVWPINISACAIGALLSIFRFSRKLLFVVPAIVGTVWTLDSAAYMIASATQSMALWTDMYVKGGAPMAVRDYTITAIVTATTFAAVYPNTLPRGPLWTRALVVLRLGGNMANYMGAYGIGAATMAIALPCSILGTVASVSLVRPSWVFLQLSGLRKAAKVVSKGGRSNVLVENPDGVAKKARRLKKIAWAGIIVSWVCLLAPGDWASGGM